MCGKYNPIYLVIVSAERYTGVAVLSIMFIMLCFIFLCLEIFHNKTNRTKIQVILIYS